MKSHVLITSAALAAAALLSSATGQSSNRASSSGTKLIVHDRASVSRLVSGGGRVIGDYGSFVVIESTRARAELAVEKTADVREDFDRIFLNSGALETRSNALQSARRRVLAGEGKTLRLVQFAGPVTPAWYKMLVETGVEVVTYLPENAYLVYGKATNHAALQDSAGLASAIQWEGDYVATHKIHPDAAVVGSDGQPRVPATDMFTFQLVADKETNEATAALIDSLKLDKVYSDDLSLNYRNITVRLNPAEVARVAAQPDVVSVQVYLIPRKMDERQNMILTGLLTGPNPAGGYLSWLAGRGFTQAQFTASGFAVDVTDSGIDNATQSPNHFGLYVNGLRPGTSRVVYNRLEGTPNSGQLAGQDGHGTVNSHIIAGYNDLNAAPISMPTATATAWVWRPSCASVRRSSSIRPPTPIRISRI